MAAGFRTRRIKTESSIGDKLKKARTRKKISVSEVEEATKIRARFILALESDSWEQIPCEAYGRGYLEAYSQFLGLDQEGVMRQYSKERELYARHCQDAKIEFTPPNRLSLPRFLLTPRFFVHAAVALVIVTAGGLATYQLQRFSAAPFLELAVPVQAKEEGGAELIVTTNSVTISGRTAMGATVMVSGSLVQVGSDGSFSSVVSVQKGSNPILIEATNGNGKKSSEIVNVLVK